MREIRFKGFAMIDGEKVFGSLLTEHFFADEREKTKKKFFILRNRTTSYGKVFFEHVEVEEGSIGQFTGFYDVEKLPIFEGDLVLFEGIKKIVRYRNGYFCVVRSDGSELLLSSIAGDLELVLQELEHLVVFTVTSNIYDPIEGAKITIDGRELTTDEEGVATIALINGLYHYEIEAEGYKTVEGDVTIEDEDADEDVVMVPVVSTHTVTFTVTYDDGGIEGAEIAIDEQTLITDDTGVASVELINGLYSYEVTATGFLHYNNHVMVSGEDEEITIILEQE